MMEFGTIIFVENSLFIVILMKIEILRATKFNASLQRNSYFFFSGFMRKVFFSIMNIQKKIPHEPSKINLLYFIRTIN